MLRNDVNLSLGINGQTFAFKKLESLRENTKNYINISLKLQNFAS